MFDLAGQEDDSDVGRGKGRYGLLFFLRDLEVGDGKPNEFVAGLRDAPGGVGR